MKLLQWNLENFFINLDKYDYKTPIMQLSDKEWESLSIAREVNKPLPKLLDIKDIFLQQSPDVAALCEIGTKESLDNFVEYFLPEYEVQMVNGRSRRGIDCGFLTKKNSEYTFNVSNVVTYKLSRTVVRLDVKKAGRLEYIILGVHIKAKSSSEADWFSLRQRAEELNELTQIVQRLKENYPEIPVLVAGDFNGELVGEYGCDSIQQFANDLKVVDLHQLKESDVETRCTFVRMNPRNLSQLDYVFIEQKWQHLVDLDKSRTYRFMTYYDIELPLPDSFVSRNKLPSDHYPTIVELKKRS